MAIAKKTMNRIRCFPAQGSKLPPAAENNTVAPKLTKAVKTKIIRHGKEAMGAGMIEFTVARHFLQVPELVPVLQREWAQQQVA